jgi:hypothetical protein
MILFQRKMKMTTYPPSVPRHLVKQIKQAKR